MHPPGRQSPTVNRQSIIAVIPARMNSSRFPGKVLANRTGKPLIQHVYERARKSALIARVIVAADDDRIVRAVTAFGGEAVMTRPDHPNGTCRIAEAVTQFDASIIVNVQGDEPDIEPGLIDRTVHALIDHPDCQMSTLASRFAPEEDPSNPNIVKVVVDQSNRAMYFSRNQIPCVRDTHDAVASGLGAPLKHVGLYVYRRDFLDVYTSLALTPLEQAEKLEQLRVLEHGYRIAVAIGEAHFHGIDTPEQYEAFVRRNNVSA